MVYRIFVEKKNGFDVEAKSYCSELKTFLGIKGVDSVRVINRYDVEKVSKELFDSIVNTVLSEPQVDTAQAELKVNETDFVTAALPSLSDTSIEILFSPSGRTDEGV